MELCRRREKSHTPVTCRTCVSAPGTRSDGRDESIHLAKIRPAASTSVSNWAVFQPWWRAGVPGTLLNRSPDKRPVWGQNRWRTSSNGDHSRSPFQSAPPSHVPRDCTRGKRNIDDRSLTAAVEGRLISAVVVIRSRALAKTHSNSPGCRPGSEVAANYNPRNRNRPGPHATVQSAQ